MERMEHIATTTPKGTPVLVITDERRLYHTVTQSVPWQLGHGAWVVKIEGKSSGYALERCYGFPPSPWCSGCRGGGTSAA